MQKDTAYVNKVVQKKDYERSMQHHLQNIRNMKPLTRPSDGNDVFINNKKKQYQNQVRFTQIERQNRMLLQKISSIMSKTKRSGFRNNNNKSLNSTYKKRQNQDIQIQNARLLKRLQQKRANYQTQKFNKDWIKQKYVMKIMSNYPFILDEKQKRNSVSHMDRKSTTEIEPIQMIRVRVINGINFLVTLQLSAKMLRIIADCKERKQVKLITIQRDEAIQFIDEQCQGRLQEVFNHLRYDKQQSTLYLVGSQVQIDQLIARQRENYAKSYLTNATNEQKDKRRANPEINEQPQEQQQIQDISNEDDHKIQQIRQQKK